MLRFANQGGWDGRGTWGEEEKCSQGFSREGNPEGKLAASYDIDTHGRIILTL